MAVKTDIKTDIDRAAAHNGAPDSKGAPVTATIRHHVKKGAKKQYEAWLKKISAASSRFPGRGHLNIIRPTDGSGVYTLILQFDSVEHLQAWLQSKTRAAFIDEAEGLLDKTEVVDVQTGLEFWFEAPQESPAKAKPYKQYLVTLAGLFPISLTVQTLTSRLPEVYPALGNIFIRTLINGILIVGMMVFVVMPRLTRLLSKWLFR